MARILQCFLCHHSRLCCYKSVYFRPGKILFPYCFEDDGDIYVALKAIEKYCAKKSIPLSFYVVPREMMPLVALRYDNYNVSLNRNESEYIYLAEDLRLFPVKNILASVIMLTGLQNCFPMPYSDL